jgi:CubicO group peptidase (beta-lactamase class C family)
MFGSRALVHEPGAEFRYSNFGFILLGAIIERVSGVVVLRLCADEDL